MTSPTIKKYGLLLLDAEQGSDEWVQARLGKPTASNFNLIVTPQGKPSGSRYGFLGTLLEEFISGDPSSNFKSDDMQHGNNQEARSRAMYELETGHHVIEVGGVFADESQNIMVSPDGLIPELRKGFEAKNPKMKTHIKYCMEGICPVEYQIQVQGNLAYTNYDTWDFISFCPEWKPQPLFLITVRRDEKIIAAIKEEVGKFSKTLEAFKRQYQEAA